MAGGGQKVKKLGQHNTINRKKWVKIPFLCVESALLGAEGRAHPSPDEAATGAAMGTLSKGSVLCPRMLLLEIYPREVIRRV